MLKCNNCTKSFPNHLVQPMFIKGEYWYFCGKCALEIRNKLFGLPESMPFQGEMANEIYEETLEYLQEEK